MQVGKHSCIVTDVVFRKHASVVISYAIWGFPNTPFVKCRSGVAEVPYQVRPWSLPDAPRMPKNKSKEACLVPAPKARLYRKVLVAKCLPGVAEGPYQGQPVSPRTCFKNVLGTRLEGTFECKARLENPEPFICVRSGWVLRALSWAHSFPVSGDFGVPDRLASQS